jgi:curved DNA-binding protein CbpA
MPADSEPFDAYGVLQVVPHAHQSVIRAAYRALAALYHPDANRVAGAERRMADLNAAYAQIGAPDRRALYDHLNRPDVRTMDAPSTQPSPSAEPRAVGPVRVLDFGRYEGWAVADVARHDPDYLRWLGRHSSGIRYRREIMELLKLADARERLRPQGSGIGATKLAKSR